MTKFPAVDVSTSAQIIFNSYRVKMKVKTILVYNATTYVDNEKSFCEERERSAHTHREHETEETSLISSSSTMYMDSNLKAEVLSSVLGQIVKLYDKNLCKTKDNILSVDDFHLHNLIGRQQTRGKQFFIDGDKFFDSVYDYDFTDLSDSAECKRGDELYQRPKGWYRMALKVKGRYPDGDAWLGTKGWRSNSVPGEWPVSYHGTSLDGVNGIIRSNYTAGGRALFGRGIYSTPDIQVAEREDYAKTFTSKTNGKSYKVILQNRINPEKREICQKSDYWLIPVPKGAPAEEEKQIVESSIRPYGVLIKEINDPCGSSPTSLSKPTEAPQTGQE